jgi:hypothetical protein
MWHEIVIESQSGLIDSIDYELWIELIGNNYQDIIIFESTKLIGSNRKAYHINQLNKSFLIMVE